MPDGGRGPRGGGRLGLGTDSAETQGPGRSMASGIGRAQHWAQEELQPKSRFLCTSLAITWADITSHWPPGSSFVCKGAPRGPVMPEGVAWVR